MTGAEAIGAGPPRALLVEDEEYRLAPLLEALAEFGVAADTARTAAEGIRLIRAHAYALVVLDLYLEPGDPRLDRKLGPDSFVHWGGVLILEEIARLGYPAELVVTTASISSAVEVRRLCDLDFHLLDKPVDLRAFRKVVARVVGGSAT